MNDLPAVVVLGLASGLQAGLLGVGIVLIYRSSRFINFAQGQMGSVASAALAVGVLRFDLPYPVAIVGALLLGVVTGMATERLLGWRLFEASRLALLVATIGVAQLILILVLAGPLEVDPTKLAVEGYPQPFDLTWHLGSAVITSSILLTLILAPALAVGLYLFLDRTRTGRAIRGAASNPDAARLAGISVRRVSLVVWALAGLVSSVAAILYAPSQPAIGFGDSGPGLLLRGLAAALLAGLVDFRLALVAGVALGIAEQATLFYTDVPGLTDVVVALAVAVGLLWRSAALRRDLLTDAPMAVGRSRRRADATRPPRRLVRRPEAAGWVALLALVAVAPLLPGLRTQERAVLLVFMLAFALVGMALTVVTGWAGQVSLGQFAFLGVGAYVATLTDELGIPVMLLAAGLGRGRRERRGRRDCSAVPRRVPRRRDPRLRVRRPGVAVPPGDLHGRRLRHRLGGVAPPVRRRDHDRPRRLRDRRRRPGPRRALAPLDAPDLGGAGDRGESRQPRARVVLRDLSPPGPSHRDGHRRLRERRGRWSLGHGLGQLELRRLRPVDVVRAARRGHRRWAGHPAGPDPRHHRRVRVALPGAGLQHARDPVAHVRRPAAGDVAVRPRRPGLGAGPAPAAPRPTGTRRAGGGRRSPRHRAGERPPAAPRHGSRAADADTDADAPDPLVVRDLARHFGGIRAVDGASLHVGPGEIVGLIGGNGAGKTTLLDLVSGHLRSDAGTVVVAAHDLTAAGPGRRPALGLVRTFQDGRLFPGLTVLETVLVAADRREPSGVVGSMLGSPWSRVSESAKRRQGLGLLDRFGLADRAEDLVGELSTGMRRVCDLAAVVAAAPSVVVLDEPTAGLAQREAEAALPLLRGLRDIHGASVLVVEHDMPLLMGLCDRMYCLEAGRVIAEGTPDEVRADPAVVASYLGLRASTAPAMGVR